MEKTVITLGPGGGETQVVSFEEAFGEHSEFRGRGRSRKQARRMDRKKKKQERRMTKISDRAERRRAKRAMRAEAMRDRQMKRTDRKTMLLERKRMGDDPELQETGLSASEEGAGSMDNQNQYETPVQDQGFEEQGGGNDPGDGGEGYGYAGPEINTGSENQGGEEGFEEDNEEGGEGYDEGEEGGGDNEDYGFDGSKTQTQDPYSLGPYSLKELEIDIEDISDIYTGADGQTHKINRPVQKLVVAIEKTKAKIVELTGKLKDAQDRGEMERVQKISARLEWWKNELKELQDKLINYAAPAGADGRRRKHSGRIAEVRSARRNLGRAVGERRRLYERQGGSETPVQSDLNPKFAEQEIVIEGELKSNAQGTGLNGLDYINDFDAPETRTVELSSNAEGPAKSKINWKYVAIGIGVGILAIYLYKKYVKK